MATALSSRNRSTASIAAATAATLLGALGTLYYLDIPSFLRQRVKTRKVEARCFSESEVPSLAAFKSLTQQRTLHHTYPLANRIEQDLVPVYLASDFDLLDDSSKEAKDKLRRLSNELYHNLVSGPGVYVIKGFYANTTTIDAANVAFASIVERERREAAAAAAVDAAGGNVKKGDHFAPASANTRIWNSFQKHGLEDPAGFVEYYSNPWLNLVCDSYLGPGYKVTTQMNTVHPGGRAQMPHRDYHLGFQTDADVVAWPKVVHALSGMLTLQGAVAHTDMPWASGPTRLLPYSQTFEQGFRSYRRKEFVEYFLQNYIAVPLEKGDALFFSPALFHAAGDNDTSDFDRTANLVQVSSAFGKPMEAIDTLALIEATYDELIALANNEGMGIKTQSLIRAVAEGYPFPTNLDSRPPAPGGMAPESEQDVLRRCISERRSKQSALEELTDMHKRSRADANGAGRTAVFGT